MGFRFFRRVRIAPGLTVNLSKSGASLSVGPRGAKYTIGPRGNRATVGLPGTGLFYTVHEPRKSRPTPARNPLELGILQRWTTPASEQAFIAGLKALDQDEAEARKEFTRGADLADAAWMLGLLCLKEGDRAAAREHLGRALDNLRDLGSLFAKYAVTPEALLQITPEITAHIQPTECGTRLALVELAQAESDRDGAMAELNRLLILAPEDPVVVLSFLELALDQPDDMALMERVVSLSANMPNETAIDTAILLYRSRALTALGLKDAAIQVLTLANRRHKDRPAALMRQIRYDRAVLYADLGRNAQARREFERLYAEDPDFAEVRERLSITR